MNGGKTVKGEGKLSQRGGVRNHEIDFWRIVMALVVLIHHSHGLEPLNVNRYPFVGGYLAVEFFFILSGYFAAEKTRKRPDVPMASAFTWSWQKICRIWRYVIPAVGVYYLVDAAISKLNFYETVKSLAYGTFEMLLLPASGLYMTFLDAPLWFLSALLILTPLLYAALLKGKDTFVYVICPFCAVMIYGHYCYSLHQMAGWGEWNGIFLVSIPRAWAGLCLGCFVSGIVRKIQEVKITKLGTHILTGMELLCMGLALYYMYTRILTIFDYLCVGLFAVALTIALSGKSSISSVFPWWISKLSGFALALYVSHWMIRMLIPLLMPDATYTQRLFPYILISVLYAALLELCAQALTKSRLIKKAKRLMIE